MKKKGNDLAVFWVALLAAAICGGVLPAEASTNAHTRSPQVRLEKYDVGNMSRIEREARREPKKFALVLYHSRLPANLEHNLATVTRVENVKLIDLDEEANKKHRYYFSYMFKISKEWDKTNLLVFFPESNKIVKYVADERALRKIDETVLSSAVENPFSLLNYHLAGNYVYYFFSIGSYIKGLQFLSAFSHNSRLYALACGVGAAFAVLVPLVLVALNFNVDQLSEKQRSIAGNKVKVSHPTQIVSSTKNPAAGVSMRTGPKSSQHLSSSTSKTKPIKKRK